MGLRAIDELTGSMRDLGSIGDALKVTGASSAPLPITGMAVVRAKQKKVTLSTTAQKVLLDNLVKMQLTNRSSAIVYSSLFGNEDGTYQVETNSIASPVLVGGDLDVIVTAPGMTGTPKTITPSVLGTLQVETIACTGGIAASVKQVVSVACTAGESTGAGDTTMTITATGMSNSPKDVIVPVVLADGINDVGLALRTALEADVDVSAFFDVSGADDVAILTAKTPAGDDATMAFGFIDTDSTGVTFGSTVNVTAGVADASGNITMTITASGMTGSPEDVVVPLVEDSDTSAVALAVRTALEANVNVDSFFTISGTGANVVMTAKVAIADDATIAFGFVDTDTTGATFGASGDTVAGVVASTAAEIAEIIKDALNADGDISAFFTATRSGDDVIITADAFADNDVTINLSVAEGTASGFTDSLLSVTTTEGYASGGDWDEIGGHGTLTEEPPPMATNSSPFTFIWLKSSGTPSIIIRGWKEA